MVAILYLALIPFSVVSYAKVKRQRARRGAPLAAGAGARGGTPPQGGNDRRPMRLQSELEDGRQRDQQADEENDRKRVSHSFSPDLSTAKVPEA